MPKHKDESDEIEPYSYRLTLEVTDFGTRSYAAAQSFYSSDKMISRLTADIREALRIMDHPPTPAELVGGVNYGGSTPLGLVSQIMNLHTEDHDIEDVFSGVTIDLAKIDPDMKAADAWLIQHYANQLGWKVIDTREPKDDKKPTTKES